MQRTAMIAIAVVAVVLIAWAVWSMQKKAAGSPAAAKAVQQMKLDSFHYGNCDGIYTYDEKTKTWSKAGPDPRMLGIDGKKLECYSADGGWFGERMIVSSAPVDQKEVTWTAVK